MKNTSLLLCISACFFFIVGCATSQSPESIAAQNEINEIDKKLEKTPDNPDLLWQKALNSYELAKMEKDKKGIAESADILQNLHLKFPNNERIVLALYDIHYRLVTLGQLNEFTNAQKYYGRLSSGAKSQFAPPSLSLFWGRTDNPKVLNDHKKTDEEFYEDIQPILRDAIKENPNFAASYAILAETFLRQGKLNLAKNVSKQALKKFPNNFSLLKKTSSAYTRLATEDGCYYDHIEDIKQGIDFGRKALKQNPKDFELRYDLIDIYQVVNPVLAINEARILNRLENSSDSRINLASMLNIYGDKSEALRIINEENKTLNEYWRSVKTFLAFHENDYRTADKHIRPKISSSIYSYITKGMVRELLGEKNAFARYSAKGIRLTEKGSWEESLLQFVSGSLSESQLQEKVKTSCQSLEVIFYSGFKDYTEGDIAQAKVKFNKVIELNLPGMSEHLLSNALLQKM